MGCGLYEVLEVYKEERERRYTQNCFALEQDEMSARSSLTLLRVLPIDVCVGVGWCWEFCSRLPLTSSSRGKGI